MAIETPHLGRFSAQKVLRLHVTTPRAEMQQAMQAALGELTGALRATGVTPCGPWFAFHHRRPTDTFDFDVCFPVEQAIEITGELQYASLPEFDVVRTAYHGPYEGLPTAWPEFHRWVEHRGHRITEQAIERYSVGPGETEDPQSWQTDLMFILADGQVSKERLV